MMNKGKKKTYPGGECDLDFEGERERGEADRDLDFDLREDLGFGDLLHRRLKNLNKNVLKRSVRKILIRELDNEPRTPATTVTSSPATARTATVAPAPRTGSTTRRALR